jgi:hypothetical protein
VGFTREPRRMRFKLEPTRRASRVRALLHNCLLDIVLLGKYLRYFNCLPAVSGAATMAMKVMAASTTR